MLGQLSLLALATASTLVSALQPVPGPAQTYAKCQRHSCGNPLWGCPSGTVYVSQTDKSANFTKIQDAIDFLGNDTAPAYILVGKGIYNEQLNVTRQGPLTLLGQSAKPNKGIRYSDRQGADANNKATFVENKNEVQVFWNAANYNSRFPDNVFTSALVIGPSLNATYTGAGPTGYPVDPDTPFGCVDFRAYNIDFRNDEFPRSNGPAHALGVAYANAGFYSCGFYSYQDTVFIGKKGNAYFYDNVIGGQTDFLYGFGTAYLESSTLSLRNCGGGITAWKGTNTTFENKYGVYISDTRVVAANSTIAPAIHGKCALGRPWNMQHRSVFMKSYFDSSVLAQGYIPWGGSSQNVGPMTFMAVWNNRGPGNNVSAQIASNLTKVLDDNSVEPFRYPTDVFITEDGKPGNVGWIDTSVLVAGQRNID